MAGEKKGRALAHAQLDGREGAVPFYRAGDYLGEQAHHVFVGNEPTFDP
jgi:hypothetical protein